MIFTNKNTLTSAFFRFLIHGNLFLSLFAKLLVLILFKISNDHLHYLPRSLRNFGISLQMHQNVKNTCYTSKKTSM